MTPFIQRTLHRDFIFTFLFCFVPKSPEQIHYNMSRIRCKDTGIEIALRKELWSRGLRYRKNAKNIPGKPDIVFIGKKIAVFCDSEFWHGFDWDNRKKDIKSNLDYWIPKIESNMQRDQEVNRQLSEEGWLVLRFWGKQIQKDVCHCADIVELEFRNR